MKLPSGVIPLCAVAMLASGCASPGGRNGDDAYPNGPGRWNEGRYGVVASIQPDLQTTDANAGAAVDYGGDHDRHGIATGAQQPGYVIRVRYNNGALHDVVQSKLDGMRVGDSVRVERDRIVRF
jgi:hypothetical protein